MAMAISAMLLHQASAALALEGCFCAKAKEKVHHCGRIDKFDPYGSITITEDVAPIDLPAVAYVECKNPEDRRIETPPPPPPPASNEGFGIYGSNTIGEKLMPELLKAYGVQLGLRMDSEKCAGPIRFRRAQDANAASLVIDCHAEGSHTGIPALVRGAGERNAPADIAMLSRRITPEEQRTMSEAGFPNMTSAKFENVIALDGLLILVSPSNPVRSLSLPQIAKVFAGEITNWAQLGGVAGPIHLYVRNEESGTRDTFESLVMIPQNKRLSPSAREFTSSSELSDLVASDNGSIGFAGFAYKGRAAALSISEACGIAHAPDALEIKTEDYPLVRRLYLYTGKLHSLYSQNLVFFVDSDQAQRVITGAGFIDQAIETGDVAGTEDRIERYARMPTQEPGLEIDQSRIKTLLKTVRGASRLSIDFRFEFGSAKLDTKALSDVVRLADFIKRLPSSKKVLLLGFADAKGSFGENLLLSRERAVEVRDALMKVAGTELSSVDIDPQGYSKLLPVACNSSDAGREKNRRVEVWIGPRS
jgi:phosphate transport system substrate-binding protein